MKQLFLFAVLVSTFFACSGNQKQTNTTVAPIALEQLLATADKQLSFCEANLHIFSDF